MSWATTANSPARLSARARSSSRARRVRYAGCFTFSSLSSRRLHHARQIHCQGLGRCSRRFRRLDHAQHRHHQPRAKPRWAGLADQDQGRDAGQIHRADLRRSHRAAHAQGPVGQPGGPIDRHPEGHAVIRRPVGRHGGADRGVGKKGQPAPEEHGAPRDSREFSDRAHRPQA